MKSLRDVDTSLITVKYIGKWDSMVCDYNGKRYCFRARERVQTIPSEVYRFILQAKDILSTEIVPYKSDDAVQEDNKDKGFVTLSMKEYAKLSKADKDQYRVRKAEAEKENVK